MKRIRQWRAARSGDAITITGVDADTGEQIKISVTEIVGDMKDAGFSDANRERPRATRKGEGELYQLL